MMIVRHYRVRIDETPSHTGGVSNEYLKKAKDRRDVDRGVYASSKDQERIESREYGKHCIVSKFWGILYIKSSSTLTLCNLSEVFHYTSPFIVDFSFSF